MTCITANSFVDKFGQCHIKVCNNLKKGIQQGFYILIKIFLWLDLSNTVHSNPLDLKQLWKGGISLQTCYNSPPNNYMC